jgi:WhiB family transcriptional regulator, redox-sensing transcriptional regulator
MSRAAAPPTAPRLDRFLLTQRDRGACTAQTAELFFDDGQAGRKANARARQQAAKAICRLCPVLMACRAFARADPSLEGIWGGETETERRAARHQPSPVGDNVQGRRLATIAAQRARQVGLDAAAAALSIPPATLRRVLALYGLDLPSAPAGRAPNRR